MSANFTPVIGSLKNIKDFRFWCQKVLPLVYDDSLSYYELLCKVVNYLNDVIVNSNEVNNSVVALYEAFKSLEEYVNNYFDNLNVEQEIENYFNNLLENGTISDLINETIFNTLNNKIDSVFINVLYPGRNLKGYNGDDDIETRTSNLQAIFDYVGNTRTALYGQIQRCTYFTVFFPKGIYDFNSVNIPPYCSIIGEHSLITGNSQFVNNTAHDLSFVNINFHSCNNTPIVINYSNLDSTRVLVRDCTFVNCPKCANIEAKSCKCVVERCSFDGCKSGITCWSDSLTVRNCWFEEIESAENSDFLIECNCLVFDDNLVVPRPNNSLAYVKVTKTCVFTHNRCGGEPGSRSSVLFSPEEGYSIKDNKEVGMIVIRDNYNMYNVNGGVLLLDAIPACFVFDSNKGGAVEQKIVSWNAGVPEETRANMIVSATALAECQWYINTVGRMGKGDNKQMSYSWMDDEFVPLCRFGCYSLNTSASPLNYSFVGGTVRIMNNNVLLWRNKCPLIKVFASVGLALEINVCAYVDHDDGSKFKVKAWTTRLGVIVDVPVVFTENGESEMKYDSAKYLDITVGNEDFYINNAFGLGLAKVVVAGSGNVNF